MQNGNEKVDKNWKDVAASIYIQHPDWNSGQIHRELISKLGESAPTHINTVQKWRNTAKPRMDAIQESGLDGPFHVGLFRNSSYGFTPESLPYIFMVRQCEREFHNEVLSIRQAQWVNRLYAYYAYDINKAREKGKQKDFENLVKYLATISDQYAQEEILSDLLGVDIDTKRLDLAWEYGELTKYSLGKIISHINTGVLEKVRSRKIKWDAYIDSLMNEDGEQ